MNNDQLDNIYGQTTKSRTYRFCQLLQDQNNDIHYLLELIHNELFKTRTYNTSSDSTEPRAKEVRTSYTHANIEKNLCQANPLARYSQKLIIAADKLCRNTLTTILQYFKTNQTTNYENFCLFYFLGNIFSHLPELRHSACQNYHEALRCLSVCTFIKEKEEKFQEIDAARIFKKIQCRLLKHEALSFNLNLNHLGRFQISLIDALTAKTYICKRLFRVIYSNSFQTQTIFCIKNINVPKIFESISDTRFSKLVLQLNALDSIHHSRFKIIFSETINFFNPRMSGSYNSRNSIRININQTGVENVLFHELTHRAMDRIFNNRSNPYFKNNQAMKLAYRKSIKQVLINSICLISPKLKINNCSLNQLVQRYFTADSKFMTCQSESRKEFYTWRLHDRLRTIFTVYSISDLDREFITNVSQYINEADKESQYFEIIQPLMNFIDMYVIPEMEKYINQHPCRRQIKD